MNTIVIDGTTYEYSYRCGDENAVLSVADLNDGVYGIEKDDGTVEKIIANLDGIADLRTDENFMHEQDLLLADNEINVITKLWWFRREKNNPTGVIFDTPVFQADFGEPESYALIVGESENVLVKG